MTLISPRTGLLPEPQCLATMFHLRIPHGTNWDFTHTIEPSLSEAGLLIALNSEGEKENVK